MTAHHDTNARDGVEWVQLWDGRRWPGRVRDGLPEFRFGQAPAGLSTRRQLRERGLSRGEQEPFAKLTWRRDRRFAWLYVDAKARAKRTPSDKQLAAVNKALAARKVCAECGPVEHFVRTTDQLCGDCHAAGVTPSAGGTTGWRTIHGWQAGADNDADNDADDLAEPPGTERENAPAAADRAAEALVRTVTRLETAQLRSGCDTDGATAGEAARDEHLARWHADDQAARLAAEHADAADGEQWRDERGVA